MDQWLEISQALVPGSGFEGACAAANDFLSLRTFLVGHAPTLADVACWAQLQLTLQWDRLKKGGSLPHLARWWVLRGATSGRVLCTAPAGEAGRGLAGAAVRPAWHEAQGSHCLLLPL